MKRPQFHQSGELFTIIATFFMLFGVINEPFEALKHYSLMILIEFSTSGTLIMWSLPFSDTEAAYFHQSNVSFIIKK